MLSDRDIIHEDQYGELNIDPLSDEQVQPSSVDLTLDDQIVFFDQNYPLVVDDPSTYPEPIVTDDLTIPGFGFALGQTREVVEVPDYLEAEIKGRSSVGRLGLFVHNAGLADPGFDGNITLELFNCAPYPIELVGGMRICQMTLTELKSKASDPYDGKYQGQNHPQPSRLYRDFE